MLKYTLQLIFNTETSIRQKHTTICLITAAGVIKATDECEEQTVEITLQ